MTPLDYYHQQCETGTVSLDTEQLAALQHLQTIYTKLLHEHKQRKKWLAKLRKPQCVTGLYMWGGVGIGKTFLLDCFYHCIPFANKMRMHFHQFMRMVHHELKQYQGQKNPLDKIAKKIARQTMLLCFDEFYVTDIADAMILARLLNALFANGVCLVTTSNTEPNQLYRHGLQRPLFLPAIALLQVKTHVIHLVTAIDYRLRYLQQAGVFYTPNDNNARDKMEKCFAMLASDDHICDKPIVVNGRHINIQKKTNEIIWFDFIDICSVPRSQIDYLVIAEQYKSVFVSNIPVISPDARNTISLFIRLIDVLYDARIRLVYSAAVPVAEIYKQGYLFAEFARTRSRLLEMQSTAYFCGEILN